MALRPDTGEPLNDVERPGTPAPEGSPSREDPPRASLRTLAATFFVLGSTTFGGLWAATRVLERELVHRRRWLAAEDVHILMLGANLVPAPKFVGFGALVGYRLRGWSGSVVAFLGLVAPSTLLVLAAVVLVPPDVLAGPLAPVQRAVTIAVVGLLFGNAWQQLKGSKTTQLTRAIGTCLSLVVASATIAGVPLVITALGGFAAGALLMRDRRVATKGVLAE